MKNIELTLEEIYLESRFKEKIGSIATYIPELANVNPDCFGISLTTIQGENFGVGDSEIRFSIQSISKPLSLALVFSVLGDKIWERVGVEPSGTAFNSLVQLEFEKGIPRNPFINAGAIVIADMVVSNFKNPKEEFIDFVRSISGISTIEYDLKVAQSEKSEGCRNAALANFLKSFGNLKNDVDVVLDFYFHQCSISMSCHELTKAYYFLANEGVSQSGKQVLSQSQVKRINAIMQPVDFMMNRVSLRIELVCQVKVV